MYVCALASDSKLVTSYLSNESYYCVNPNRIMLQTSLLSLIYRSNMDFIIRKEILTRLFSLCYSTTHCSKTSLTCNWTPAILDFLSCIPKNGRWSQIFLFLYKNSL